MGGSGINKMKNKTTMPINESFDIKKMSEETGIPADIIHSKLAGEYLVDKLKEIKSKFEDKRGTLEDKIPIMYEWIDCAFYSKEAKEAYDIVTSDEFWNSYACYSFTKEKLPILKRYAFEKWYEISKKEIEEVVNVSEAKNAYSNEDYHCYGNSLFTALKLGVLEKWVNFSSNFEEAEEVLSIIKNSSLSDDEKEKNNKLLRTMKLLAIIKWAEFAESKPDLKKVYDYINKKLKRSEKTAIAVTELVVLKKLTLFFS